MLDDFNLKILDLLQEDARIPFASIGKKIGLTAPAVAQRIKQLEADDVIKRYTAMVNYSKLGFDIKVLVPVKLFPGKLKVFEQMLKKMAEIQTCYRVTGEDCMILIALLKDNRHLVQFIDSMVVYGTTKTNVILEEHSVAVTGSR